ncbi:hypothetical protein R84865_001746 [Carnimonas sp. R-84865]
MWVIMKNITVSRTELASLIIAAVALILLLPFKLLAPMLAGLLVFELINALTPMVERLISYRFARAITVALLTLIILGGLSILVVGAFSLVLHEVNNPARLTNMLLDVVEQARRQLPNVLTRYLPSSADDFHSLLKQLLHDHTSELKTWGTGAVHLFVKVLLGMVLGAVIALVPSPSEENMKPLAAALYRRVNRLAAAFHQIVFAQIRISLLNTVLTGVFLLVVLPLAGVHLPLAKTLVIVTFIVGLLPIVGNLISNAIICVIGLSVSLWVAISVLVYLVVVHKLEYFFNARIVGGSIHARAWELLLAMLVFETLFGLGGLIAAPIYYAYMKMELREKALI